MVSCGDLPDIYDKLYRFGIDGDKLRVFVQGTESQTVALGNVTTPTLRKLTADMKALIDAGNGGVAAAAASANAAAASAKAAAGSATSAAGSAKSAASSATSAASFARMAGDKLEAAEKAQVSAWEAAYVASFHAARAEQYARDLQDQRELVVGMRGILHNMQTLLYGCCGFIRDYGRVADEATEVVDYGRVTDSVATVTDFGKAVLE